MLSEVKAPLLYRRLFSFKLILGLVAFVSGAPCQTPSKVQGTITEGNLDPVPGATVSLRGLSNGLSYADVTDRMGKFEIDNVEIGTYRIAVRKLHYRRPDIPPIEVDGTGPHIQNVALKLSMRLSEAVLGVALAVLLMVLASRWVPRALAALSAPLGRMRKGDPDNKPEIEEQFWFRVVQLWAVYFGGSFLFSATGGGLGTLLTSTGEIPRNALIGGCAAGLIVVSLARIEAVSYSTGLSDSLQPLFISVPGAISFLLVAEPEIVTTLVDEGKVAVPNLIFFVFVGSTVACGLTEAVFWIGGRKGAAGFQKVPFSLVRQRVEQWEQVDQVWEPTAVLTWTIEEIDRAASISSGRIKEICWLTTCHPRPLVSHLLQVVSRSAAGIKIVIPEAALHDFRLETRGLTIPSGSVRVLGSSSLPRVRLLTLSPVSAVMHLPIEFDDSRTESSNYAVRVTDPARISEVQAWFDQIWKDSIAIEEFDRVTDSAAGGI